MVEVDAEAADPQVAVEDVVASEGTNLDMDQREAVCLPLETLTSIHPYLDRQRRWW